MNELDRRVDEAAAHPGEGRRLREVRDRLPAQRQVCRVNEEPMGRRSDPPALSFLLIRRVAG